MQYHRLTKNEHFVGFKRIDDGVDYFNDPSYDYWSTEAIDYDEAIELAVKPLGIESLPVIKRV